MFDEEVDVEAALGDLQKSWGRLIDLGVQPSSLGQLGELPTQNKKRILRALSSVVTNGVLVHEAILRDKQTVHDWGRDQYARTIDPSLLAFWRSVSRMLSGLLAREIHERVSFIRREILKLDNDFGLERLCGLRQLGTQEELRAARWLADIYPLISDTLDLVDNCAEQGMIEIDSPAAPQVQWVNDELRPRAKHLAATFDALLELGHGGVLALDGRRRAREIPFDDFGLSKWFLPLPARTRRVIPAKRIRELLTWSVNYWEMHIDPNEDYGAPDDEYGNPDRWAWEETNDFLTSDETWRVIGSAFFRPKLWADNAKALRPVVTSSKLPFEIRRRTEEIFDSFLIGNYVSVLLLCRGVLEYALIHRADALGIRACEHGMGNRGGVRKLARLMEDAIAKRPALAEAMEKIKERGNTFAHPRRREGEVSESEIEVLRRRALETLEYLKTVLEGLYGHGSEVSF